MARVPVEHLSHPVAFPRGKCSISFHIVRKTFSRSAQASAMPQGNIKARPQAERTLAELIKIAINDLKICLPVDSFFPLLNSS